MVDAERASEGGKGGEGDGGRRVVSARRVLALGAVVAVVGVALGGTVSRDAGGVLALVGWGLLVLGVHSFGRLGPG